DVRGAPILSIVVALVVSMILRSSLTGSTIAMIPRSLQETYRQNQRRTPYGLVVSTHSLSSVCMPICTCPCFAIFSLHFKESVYSTTSGNYLSSCQVVTVSS